MATINPEKGHGVAHDGRQFCPAIPPGASVSWKRLPEAVDIEDSEKSATHVLAVWDRFEEMGVDKDELRETPRGSCVVFLADTEAIEYLLESPIPPPLWLNLDQSGDRLLAQSLAVIRDEWIAPRACTAGPSATQEMAWLKTAVLTHHQLTDEWPLVKINVPKVLRDEPFPADKIRDEATRLFRVIRGRLARTAAISRADEGCLARNSES